MKRMLQLAQSRRLVAEINNAPTQNDLRAPEEKFQALLKELGAENETVKSIETLLKEVLIDSPQRVFVRLWPRG